MADTLKNFLRNTRLRLLTLIRKQEFNLQKDKDFAQIIYLSTECGVLDITPLSEKSGLAPSTIYRWKAGKFLPKKIKTRERFIKLIEDTLAEMTDAPRD